MIQTGGEARNNRLLEKQERIRVELVRFAESHRPQTAGLHREVAEVLGDIHEHLFDPDLNVAAVKRRCRIRNNNISTRFHWAIGRGIREYIENLRLEAASGLLRDGQLEVYLVAMAVGYDHAETFCRAFQRQFGRSPSEHRLALRPR